MRDRTISFKQKRVLSAVLQLGLPTVAGQVILVLYNLADTFFIGLTENDAKLISVTICTPAFLILSAISNLFGVGGASAISRALGAKDELRAKRASAFSICGTGAVTLLYCLLVLLLLDPLADLLGGKEPSVHENAKVYLFITVVLGGLATAGSTLFAHIIRADGYAFLSGFGVILGGILNIGLDPLLMFVLLPKDHEILGAAAATALSNGISLVYFLVVTVVLRRRGSLLRFRPSPGVFRDRIPREILRTGLSACLMTLFENLSYAILDHLMMSAGLACQAGIGVAKKLNMLSHSVTRGMAQGVLPFIAYNYAACAYSRMKKALCWAVAVTVGLSLINMGIFLIWNRPLCAVFLKNQGASVGYGAAFLQILCLGAPFSAFAYILISFFQATENNGKAFLLAILRKGAADVPLMFLLARILPVYGLVWATPAADALCCFMAAVLFARWVRTHRISGTPGIPSAEAPGRDAQSPDLIGLDPVRPQ